MKGFLQLAKLLIDLTHDNAVCHWGDAKARSSVALKVASATAPILHIPDFEKKFVVMTDASDVVVGAILEQNFGSRLQPIAVASYNVTTQRLYFKSNVPRALSPMCSEVYS